MMNPLGSRLQSEQSHATYWGKVRKDSIIESLLFYDSRLHYP